MCGTPWARAPERNTRAQLIIKYFFFRKKYNVFLLVRNIQTLGDQAQIKDDLTVLPENIVLEKSKFKYVLIRI